MAMALTCTPTVAVRWLPRSPISPPLPASNCATCTSPSPAWKISFCTIPEGACANELESLFRHARARCPCRTPQFRGTVVSDILAAADVRLHLRPRHGRQRLHAAFLQEPTASRNHGYLHGRHRHLGGRHATDRRISIHARDRGPSSRAHGNLLAGHRKSRRWNFASARRRIHGDPCCMAAAPARRGLEHHSSPAFCGGGLAGRAFL